MHGVTGTSRLTGERLNFQRADIANEGLFASWVEEPDDQASPLSPETKPALYGVSLRSPNPFVGSGSTIAPDLETAYDEGAPGAYGRYVAELIAEHLTVEDDQAAFESLRPFSDSVGPGFALLPPVTDEFDALVLHLDAVGALDDLAMAFYLHKLDTHDTSSQPLGSAFDRFDALVTTSATLQAQSLWRYATHGLKRLALSPSNLGQEMGHHLARQLVSYVHDRNWKAVAQRARQLLLNEPVVDRPKRAHVRFVKAQLHAALRLLDRQRQLKRVVAALYKTRVGQGVARTITDHLNRFGTTPAAFVWHDAGGKKVDLRRVIQREHRD